MDPKDCSIQLTSWNKHATRLVRAPLWEWSSVPGTMRYLFRFAPDSPHVRATDFDVAEPHFDMKPLWDRLPCGAYDMLIQGFDAQGVENCKSEYKRFWKVPGWDGVAQQPLDWRGAVRRNIAHLLAPPRDEVREYEKGMPRSCWFACEDTSTGARQPLGYPALHHPSFINAFLFFAESFPEDVMATDALRQAKQYGDWLLEHRQPVGHVCSLFPFSTIVDGKFEGDVEGQNITLFRAARVGEAMLELHHRLGNTAYFKYAEQIANVFLKLQCTDGSWPYRIDPATGVVAEKYTSNAITPARFLTRLAECDSEKAEHYRKASERAIAWMLENPVKTRLWQGMYEDVGELAPYANLQNWDANELIRFLCHGTAVQESNIEVAVELNHYIEDLFVVWQPEQSPVIPHVPTPAVLEQFICYWPMETHTGNWLLSLLALHQATRKEEYLQKGVAAANAIVRSQWENGALATWGYDLRFKREIETLDWPGCNAIAASALLLWDRYYQRWQKGELEQDKSNWLQA